ncbi:YafY family transcriptional regulator [Chloroflexia bacterium SDU3-3]|nr:YafY family transcriptional regulator [Chloroflexia bacterium SDU3-3]
MNRTDRLLAIVLELQARGQRRAQDLAAAFAVSKRTIYRDVLALCEAGVPVVSEPGKGYSLVEGYFLPPLRFTLEEALLLLLGSDVMAKSFDAEYRAAARNAGRKISGVLPDDLRPQVESIQERIQFFQSGRRTEAEQLPTIRWAIIKQQTLRFHYHARAGQAGDHSLDREADPYELVFVAGHWYMVAHCHMRGDIRNFRLDRIDRLSLLPRLFARPSDFAVGQVARGERQLVVRVLFDAAVARWVREDSLFYIDSNEKTASGLLVTLRVRHESDVLQWLLGWGAHARVLEPASLAQRLRAEAEALLLRYAPDEVPHREHAR